MEWLDKIIPLIGVALGWLFAQYGRYSSDKKGDKKKLNKLLFNLLELRFLLTREFSLGNDLERLLQKIKQQLGNQLGEKASRELELVEPIIKPFLIDLVKKTFVDNGKTEYLEKNIDQVINELAEVFPVFAYELNGKHKIKERLQKFDSYFNKMNGLSPEPFFEIIKDWAKLKISDEFVPEFDDIIKRIAKKINNKTYKETVAAIQKQDQPDERNFDSFFEEYLQKALEQLPKTTASTKMNLNSFPRSMLGRGER